MTWISRWKIISTQITQIQEVSRSYFDSINSFGVDHYGIGGSSLIPAARDIFAEVVDMKKKIKIMGHQIDQLKEEIAFKNSDSAKQQFEHTKLEKEKEVLVNLMGQLQREADMKSKEVQLKQSEELKLRHMIEESEKQLDQSNKDHNFTIRERVSMIQ